MGKRDAILFEYITAQSCLCLARNHGNPPMLDILVQRLFFLALKPVLFFGHTLRFFDRSRRPVLLFHLNFKRRRDAATLIVACKLVQGSQGTLWRRVKKVKQVRRGCFRGEVVAGEQGYQLRLATAVWVTLN